MQATHCSNCGNCQFYKCILKNVTVCNNYMYSTVVRFSAKPLLATAGSSFLLVNSHFMWCCLDGVCFILNRKDGTNVLKDVKQILLCIDNDLMVQCLLRRATAMCFFFSFYILQCTIVCVNNDFRCNMGGAVGFINFFFLHTSKFELTSQL